MSGFSPTRALAMERRHILEGEKRVARQEALVRELTEKGHSSMLPQSNDVLRLLRESLELSRDHFRYLVGHYGSEPKY